MYTETWDEIINNGKLELFNETNFDKDITQIMSPKNVVGIENVKDFMPTTSQDSQILNSPLSMFLGKMTKS